MALNDNTKQLIRCVSENNLQAAKACIKRILENETAASNQGFRKSIMAKLSTPESNMLELPYDLRTLLKIEDVSVSFYENRYYLTEREHEVFERITTANEVNAQLADMGIRYLNSTLLFGESGTGKTTFGRYVAYKMGIPFAYLNFSNCISSYLGSTAKNIEKIFDYIKKAKCVFMLDEIDAIGLKRGKEDVGEMSRVVIGLMQSLDLLENDVVVIGATNRIDMIDEALIRRFSMKREVKVMTTNEVEHLIEMFLADVGIQFDAENMREYSKNHNKQSEVVNDVTISIVKMLKENAPFLLLPEDDGE